MSIDCPIESCMPRARVLATALVLALCSQQALASATPVTPAIEGVVAAGTKIELVAEGLQGTEGPVALPDGSLIFTESQANRITRIGPDGKTSTFLQDTNVSNSLGFTAGGDLISVQTGKPAVGILYPAERARILVDQFEGAPFNRPNDLVVDRHGGVYFTDPGARAEPGVSAPQPAVYYLAPTGKLHRIADEIQRPNGIQLSPSENVLYIANTAGEYVLACDVKPDGTAGPRRNFAKLAGFRTTEGGPSSGADGLAVDGAGRLYVATSVGVQVFSPAGAPLGVIALPQAPQNLAFAGPGKQVLYIVGRGSVWRIPMLAAGYAGRAK